MWRIRERKSVRANLKLNSELIWVLNLIQEHWQLIAAAAAAVLVVFFVVWLLLRRARLWYWKVSDHSKILAKQEASLADISSRLAGIEDGLKQKNNSEETSGEKGKDEENSLICAGEADEPGFEGEVFSALSEKRERISEKAADSAPRQHGDNINNNTNSDVNSGTNVDTDTNPDTDIVTGKDTEKASDKEAGELRDNEPPTGFGTAAEVGETKNADTLKTPELENIPKAPQPTWKQVNVPLRTTETLTETLRELNDLSAAYSESQKEDEFSGFREALLKRNAESSSKGGDGFLDVDEEMQDSTSSGRTRIKFLSADQSVSRSGRVYTLEQIEEQIRD